MRFVIVLVTAGGIFVLGLIGLAWALLMLIPYYVFIVVVIYVVWRTNRRKQRQTALFEEAALRNRELDAQEYRAWLSAAEGGKRNLSKREAALRRFDSSRDR